MEVLQPKGKPDCVSACFTSDIKNPLACPGGGGQSASTVSPSQHKSGIYGTLYSNICRVYVCIHSSTQGMTLLRALIGISTGFPQVLETWKIWESPGILKNSGKSGKLAVCMKKKMLAAFYSI